MRIRFDPLDPYEQIVKSVPKHNRCDFRGNYIPRLEDPGRFARSHWVESMRTKMAFKQQCETNIYSSCQIWWGSYINMFSYLVGSNVPNYGFTQRDFDRWYPTQILRATLWTIFIFYLVRRTGTRSWKLLTTRNIIPLFFKVRLFMSNPFPPIES